MSNRKPEENVQSVAIEVVQPRRRQTAAMKARRENPTQHQIEALARGREALARKRAADKLKQAEGKVSMDEALEMYLSPTKAKRMVAKMCAMAEEGDKDMIKFIFERRDGKAVQQVEQTSNAALHVTFERLG